MNDQKQNHVPERDVLTEEELPEGLLEQTAGGIIPWNIPLPFCDDGPVIDEEIDPLRKLLRRK